MDWDCCALGERRTDVRVDKPTERVWTASTHHDRDGFDLHRYLSDEGCRSAGAYSPA
jgi:hypothetical protein